MAIGDVFRLTVKGRQSLSVRMNDLAVQYLVAEPTAAARQTLADDFKEMWRPQQSSGVTYETWELRQLWGVGMTTLPTECKRDGGVVFGDALTAPLAGSALTTAVLPPQAALVVTLVTGAIGRRKRGRWYGYGYTEDLQNAGIWDPGFLTAQTALLTTFFGKYAIGGTSPDYVLGVWSERTASGCTYTGSPPELENVDTPAPEAAFTAVTGFTLRQVVYNQRRRTVNVGA